jgi:hypothetical protein
MIQEIQKTPENKKQKQTCKKNELPEPETIEQRTSDQNKEPTRDPGMAPEGWFHAFFTEKFSTG